MPEPKGAAQPERRLVDQAVAGFRAQREREPRLTPREFLRQKGLGEELLPHLEQALAGPAGTVEVRPGTGEREIPAAATLGAETGGGPESPATIGVESEAGAETFDRRYKLVRELGAGGYGKVYLVRDALNSDEELALKLIRSDRLGTPEVIKRFKNEIRTMRALNHPGIPQIYNDGLTEGGEFYYTMAFVRGRSLIDVIRGEAPLAPDRVVRLVKQMLDVLDYAHRRGVVHRDLKPGNVIIVEPGSEEEQVKVLDFGIAKLLAREGELEHALTMNTEAAIGTPHYMAPEQVRGKAVDGRTDLYALGIIVYQMCTGKMPFAGTTVMEILSARLEQPPTPLVKGQVPEWLEALVMRLLERERDKRPTAEVVLKQLQEVARGQHVIGKQLRWVVAGVLALALSVAWLIYTRGSESRAPEKAAHLPANDAGPRLSEEQPREQPREQQGSSTPDPDPGTESKESKQPDLEVGEGSADSPPATDTGQGSERPQPPDLTGGNERESTPATSKEPVKPNLLAFEWLALEPADGTRVEPSTREVEIVGSVSAELAKVLVNGESARVDESRRAFRHVLRLSQAALANEKIALTIALTDVDGRALTATRTLWRAAARAPEGMAPAAGSEVDEDGWARVVHDPRSGLDLVRVPAQAGLPAFYIGKTEVSWASYERLMQREPSQRHDFDEAGFDKRTLDDHPVVKVSADEAQRSCAAAGFVLPTREEWVRAAGGIARVHPWGEGSALGLSNLEGMQGDDRWKLTAPCGALPSDVSHFGVLDLGGNVREWCREGASFTVSGGSWSSDEGASRIDFTPRRVATGGDDKTGFRVVLEL